jgi:hypothetical protein
MLSVGANGRRPQAWWRYEAGQRYPGIDIETSTLWEMDALGESEESEVLKRWREEFDRSHSPNFCHCRRPGEILKGALARKMHWRWADIPPLLVLRWGRERRHSAAQIRQLQTATRSD